MTIDEIKQQIAGAEGRIANQKQTLAELSERIIAEIKPFLQAWIDPFVAARVREVPETTKSLTAEQISTMKRQVRQVQTDLPRRLDEEFAKAKSWPHETGMRTPQGARPILPSFIAEPANRALRDLHPIFEQYGFIAATNYIGGKVIDWPPGILALASNYATAANELVDRQQQLEQLKRLLEQAEAADHWNKS